MATGTARYTLITANRNYSSWSLRPWVLMKTLGIAFEDRIEPFPGPDRPDAFRTFSPTGQVPVLREGDRMVWDSLGIVLYLADRHGGVWPALERESLDARAWAMAAVCEMHAGFRALRNERPMSVGMKIAPHESSDALARDLERIVALWDDGLTRFGGPFLAGPAFTAADAFFAPVVFRWRSYGFGAGRRGSAWCKRMLDLPAMKEWEEAALAETWRDHPHEEELAAIGKVTEDRRATTNGESTG